WPVAGSSRPILSARCSVYQSAPSFPSAGSCGWASLVGTSYSLIGALSSVAANAPVAPARTSNPAASDCTNFPLMVVPPHGARAGQAQPVPPQAIVRIPPSWSFPQTEHDASTILQRFIPLIPFQLPSSPSEQGLVSAGGYPAGCNSRSRRSPYS